MRALEKKIVDNNLTQERKEFYQDVIETLRSRKAESQRKTLLDDKVLDN